jgi:hypothetical protein
VGDLVARGFRPSDRDSALSPTVISRRAAQETRAIRQTTFREIGGKSSEKTGNFFENQIANGFFEA